MPIHNLQTEFHLLVAIVHKEDFRNILICAQMPRLHIDIFMRLHLRVRIRTFSAMSMHPIVLASDNYCSC